MQHECRYAETWAAAIAAEVAGENICEARSLYKRAYSRHSEESGQVRASYCLLPLYALVWQLSEQNSIVLRVVEAQ